MMASSAASSKSTSKLVEDVLVFEAGVGIVVGRAGLVVHIPFALVW